MSYINWVFRSVKLWFDPPWTFYELKPIEMRLLVYEYLYRPICIYLYDNIIISKSVYVPYFV